MIFSDCTEIVRSIAGNFVLPYPFQVETHNLRKGGAVIHNQLHKVGGRERNE